MGNCQLEYNSSVNSSSIHTNQSTRKVWLSNGKWVKGNFVCDEWVLMYTCFLLLALLFWGRRRLILCFFFVGVSKVFNKRIHRSCIVGCSSPVCKVVVAIRLLRCLDNCSRSYCICMVSCSHRSYIGYNRCCNHCSRCKHCSYSSHYSRCNRCSHRSCRTGCIRFHSSLDSYYNCCMSLMEKEKTKIGLNDVVRIPKINAKVPDFPHSTLCQFKEKKQNSPNLTYFVDL